MHVHVQYLAKIPARCVEYIQCAKILRMRKIEVTRTWYRVVSRSSVYRDRAQAHGCRSEKWPWAIIDDYIVVVGDGLQKVVEHKPDLPNRLLRPCHITEGSILDLPESLILYML